MTRAIKNELSALLIQWPTGRRAQEVMEGFSAMKGFPRVLQFGTQVKFRWSRDHNNRTAENAFSAPWYYSEMELEPVAG